MIRELAPVHSITTGPMIAIASRESFTTKAARTVLAAPVGLLPVAVVV